MKIMTPSNKKWAEFCQRLEGPEGCNFREDTPSKKITWNCKGGMDKTKAKEILIKMGMDIDKSLTYFDQHGGHCDCEILFNVDGNNQEAST